MLRMVDFPITQYVPEMVIFFLNVTFIFKNLKIANLRGKIKGTQ